MLFMWNFNLTKHIDSKLFLLINYTFYSNLNSTNFSCYLCGIFIDGKLFLLINYTFYSNLNSTNFSCYLCGISIQLNI